MALPLPAPWERRHLLTIYHVQQHATRPAQHERKPTPKLGGPMQPRLVGFALDIRCLRRSGRMLCLASLAQTSGRRAGLVRACSHAALRRRAASSDPKLGPINVYSGRHGYTGPRSGSDRRGSTIAVQSKPCKPKASRPAEAYRSRYMPRITLCPGPPPPLQYRQTAGAAETERILPGSAHWSFKARSGHLATTKAPTSTSSPAFKRLAPAFAPRTDCFCLVRMLTKCQGGPGRVNC